MSMPDPKLSRRDKIQAELNGCVEDHEKIRELLRRIDRQAPGLMPLTGDIRNFLLDLGQRYNRMRTEMAVSAMVGDGEFDAPTACCGQRPVNELPMFVGLDESPATRAKFALELAHIGDDTLDGVDLSDRVDGRGEEAS